MTCMKTTIYQAENSSYYGRLPVALLLISAALSLSVGCNPTLYAVTPAPPSRVAELSSIQPLFSGRKHVAKLSVGVALAFNCVNGSPCKNVRTTIADPGIVQVIPAHLASLERDPLHQDSRPPTTLLLVGLAPGETTVRLDSKQGSTTIRVSVLESLFDGRLHRPVTSAED